MFDLQRASMWKRISAALFDFIILLIVVTGAAFLLSTALGYDAYVTRLDAIYSRYQQEYGLDITQEQYNAFTDEEKANYEQAGKEANKAIAADEEANALYVLTFNFVLLIVAVSVLVAQLLMEFLIPLLLKNGQTLGKKIFGIGVMRVDGVKISNVQLFVRTLLGKYTVETMIPVFAVIMLFYGMLDIAGIAVLAVLGIAQIILLFTGHGRTPIHDKMAATVTVDMASQMIFDSPEAMMEYKKRIHAEHVKNSREA